eukprot:g8209.t3
MFFWASEVSWSAGNTTFAHNLARDNAGALYVTVDHRIECSDHTTFWNNTAAAGDGGALGLYRSLASSDSFVHISREATFANNRAFANGGGVFLSASKAARNFEDLTFRNNSAAVGGAVATFGTRNSDEITSEPAMFVRCRFLSNSATDAGWGVESAFGQEYFVSSQIEDNFAASPARRESMLKISRRKKTTGVMLLCASTARHGASATVAAFQRPPVSQNASLRWTTLSPRKPGPHWKR